MCDSHEVGVLVGIVAQNLSMKFRSRTPRAFERVRVNPLIHTESEAF